MMLVSLVVLLLALSVGICRQTTESDLNILTRTINQALTSTAGVTIKNGADAVGSKISGLSNYLLGRPGNMNTADRFNSNHSKTMSTNTDIVEAANGFGLNSDSSDKSNLLGEYPGMVSDESGFLSFLDSPMPSFPMGTQDPNIDSDCLLECNSNGEENCDFQCTYITDTEYSTSISCDCDSSIDPNCLSDCDYFSDTETESSSQCFITDSEYLDLVNSSYNCDIGCLSEYVYPDSDCFPQLSSSISTEYCGSDSSTCTSQDCSEMNMGDITRFSNSSYLY